MTTDDATRVFVFPGYPTGLARLKELLAYYPGLQASFDRASATTRTHLGASLADFVFARQATPDDFALSQAATYVTSYFLFETAVAAGARPAVVAGYGMGEITALAAAGVLSFEIGLQAVCLRAAAIATYAKTGAMLEVPIAVEKIRHLLQFLDRRTLQLAGVNSDRQSVVSGTTEDIVMVETILMAQGLGFRRLSSTFPLHSRGMAAAVGPYLIGLAKLPHTPARVPVYSPALKRAYTADDDIFECLAYQLIDPVDFAGAVRELYTCGHKQFVDCGSGGALAACISDVLKGASDVQVFSLDAGDGSIKGNIEQLGQAPRNSFPVEEVVSASIAAVAAPQTTLVTDDLAAQITAIYQDLTGYPPEVLEPDADLEAELGLDSVKQIEVVATIAEAFGLAPNPGFAIGDHNTIAKIVAYVEQRLVGASTPAPSSAPAPVFVPAADDLASRIAEIYRDLTGYPPEVLEPHADLEAELGLDSVKQIEVVATIAEVFSLPPNPSFSIGDHNTIAKVTAYVGDRLAETAPVQTASIPTQAGAPALYDDDDERLDMVAAKVSQIYQQLTGYPSEVLEHDADLESELGLDSVKQIEVITTIAQTFDLPDNPSFAMGDHNTIGKVVSYVEQNQQKKGHPSGKARSKKGAR